MVHDENITDVVMIANSNFIVFISHKVLLYVVVQFVCQKNFYLLFPLILSSSLNKICIFEQEEQIKLNNEK